MNQKIKNAVDHSLSGLCVTQRSRHQILNRMQGEQPVKKKLSFGLALALALIMLTAVAVAAVLLSGRDMVDQVLTPMAEKTKETRFTPEEIAEILDFAQKNDIQLHPDDLKALKSPDGYFKEELAMLFAKSSLGFYPGTWDVADQFWFEELQVKSGVKDSHDLIIPSENEKTQQQIEDIANAYILKQTGQDFATGNREKYRLFRAFHVEKDESNHETRSWRLEYEALDLTSPDFRLTLDPQGAVLTYSDTLKDTQSQDPKNQAELLYSRYIRLYTDRYGSQDAWTQAQWQELHLKLSALLKGVKDLPYCGFILNQSYAPLPENALSREAAINAAAQAVAQTYALPTDSLLSSSDLATWQAPYAIALNGDTANPVWKVSFGREYLVELNALTGEPTLVDRYAPYENPMRRYALDQLLPQNASLPVLISVS